MFKNMKKIDLENLLINEYGYDKKDLQADGKPLTNAKLTSMIKNEMEDAKKLEEVKNTRKEFKDDDLISVMNGLSGGLTHRSEISGRVWRFRDFGVIDKIPYSEILRINSNSPKVFTEGWLIILEKQIVEDFGLTEIYKNILTPKNIDQVFKKDLDELSIVLKNLPKGSRQVFFNKAKDSYSKGELDSIKLINLIETEFNTSLEDNMPIEKDS